MGIYVSCNSKIFILGSILIIILNSFHSVESLTFFGSANNEVVPSQDVSECSWCVKQMAKEIVNKAKAAMANGDEEIELKIRLHKKEVELLDEYITNDESWIRLEEILRLLNPSVNKVYPDMSELERGLSPSLIILMSTGGVTLCAMWMILSRQSVCLVAVLLILLCFSVGIAWNWWKLYNEEYSKRVNLLPDECKPGETSWLHSVKGFLIDPNCGEYFKAPVDDPVAMVSPHQVISETFAMIFISPVSMAASCFATFIRSLSDNLMWPLNWIVQVILTLSLLAAGTVFLITLIAGLFNLDMKFSTCLVSGELKPSKQRPSSLKLPSTTSSAIKSRRVRPSDLALFPAPPSPFR